MGGCEGPPACCRHAPVRLRYNLHESRCGRFDGYAPCVRPCRPSVWGSGGEGFAWPRVGSGAGKVGRPGSSPGRRLPYPVGLFWASVPVNHQAAPRSVSMDYRSTAVICASVERDGACDNDLANPLDERQVWVPPVNQDAGIPEEAARQPVSDVGRAGWAFGHSSRSSGVKLPVIPAPCQLASERIDLPDGDGQCRIIVAYRPGRSKLDIFRWSIWVWQRLRTKESTNVHVRKSCCLLVWRQDVIPGPPDRGWRQAQGARSGCRSWRKCAFVTGEAQVHWFPVLDEDRGLEITDQIKSETISTKSSKAAAQTA